MKRLVGLSLLLLSPQIHTQELTVFTEEMPPYSYCDEHSKAAGFSTDVVRELLKRSRITLVEGRVFAYSWARAYGIVKRKKNTALFSTTRTDDRERLFKWVGPIASRTVWLWTLKERRDIRIVSIEEAKPYRIGDVRGYATANYLTTLGFTLDLCNSDEQNFKKLIAHRFDILPALDLSASYQMKKDGSYEAIKQQYE